MQPESGDAIRMSDLHCTASHSTLKWRPPLAACCASAGASTSPAGASTPPAAATKLLLLHGWPEFWATWLPLMNRLHGGLRLIAPDLRGFGDSAKAAAPRSDVGANSHADDMASLVVALGLDSVGVVGHDVGAYAAQAMARRHPQLVERLLFFNCPTQSIAGRWVHDGHVNEVWYQSFQQLPLAEALIGLSRQSCALYFSHFLTHWCHRKDAFDPALELWIDNFMKPGNLRGGFDWYRSQNAARLAAIDGPISERCEAE